MHLYIKRSLSDAGGIIQYVVKFVVYILNTQLECCKLIVNVSRVFSIIFIGNLDRNIIV